MIIAQFDRTATACFFLLLIAFVTAAIAGAAYLIWNNWTLIFLGGIGAIVGLVTIPSSIFTVVGVLRDPRAIWIEDGGLHFHASFSDELVVMVYKQVVPLDVIGGLSAFKAEYSGAAEKRGVYLILKSGKVRKVMTFLLHEPENVVMSRLSSALDLPQPQD